MFYNVFDKCFYVLKKIFDDDKKKEKQKKFAKKKESKNNITTTYTTNLLFSNNGNDSKYSTFGKNPVCFAFIQSNSTYTTFLNKERI